MKLFSAPHIRSLPLTIVGKKKTGLTFVVNLDNRPPARKMGKKKPHPFMYKCTTQKKATWNYIWQQIGSLKWSRKTVRNNNGEIGHLYC